jgi:hypothetical protein
MARVEIANTVQRPTGEAVRNATVQVNLRNGAAATVYADEVSGATISNPLTTDVSGRIEGWVNEGSYDLVVSAPGLTSYTQKFEAVRGDASATTNVGDITITSDSDASGAGDIIFRNGATEAARFTGGKLGIGVTSSPAAALHVRIPGTGSIALFEPTGGGEQYYHFNELGLGAVGDNVNLPYIAVENNTAQDIKLAMSVSNAAGNLAQLAATSVSGVSTPSLKLFAPSGDIYVQPGTSTLNKNIRLWCGMTGQPGNSHVTIAKQDGTGILFDASPNLGGISFFGAGVASKQTVVGSRGANAALASLLTALATYGLVTDSSTA